MQFKFIAHSRTIIKISGPDKYNLLQGLITNDVFKAQNQCIYTAMLTPVGRYLFDFFIFADKDSLIIDIDNSQSSDFLQKIQMYKLRSQVELNDVSSQFQIVLSSEALAENSLIDPRLRALGYRTLLNTGFGEPFGDEEYEKLRISLAIPFAGKELIQDKSIILECGLDELNALDWNKGCYVGQELMARTKHRGGIHKRLMPIEFTGPTPEFLSPIMDNEREVGKIRSTHGSLAIAMLRLEAIDHKLQVNGWPIIINQPGHLFC